MGKLEGEILDAMVALCDDEPDCDRLMFVLPVRDMDPASYLGHGRDVARAGDVVAIWRDGDPREPWQMP